MNRKFELIFGVCLLILLLTSFCMAEDNTASSEPVRRLAYVSQQDGKCNVYVINSDGTGQIQLTNNGFNNYLPVWSPDGTKLLYLTRTVQSLFKAQFSLWVTAADGTEQYELSADCELNSFPVWSPDGSEILFVEKHDDGKKYPVVSSFDGQIKTVFKGYPLGSTFVNHLSWSPDGTRILGVFHLDGKDALATIQLNGAAPLILIIKNGDYNTPSWSPDGTQVAYGFNKPWMGIFSSRQGLYIIPADGGEAKFITTGKDIFNIVWAPDNTAIAFMRRFAYSTRDSNGNTSTKYSYTSYVVNVDDKKPRPKKLVEKANAAECISWAPDGSKLAYTGFFMLGVLPSGAKIYKIKVPFALGAPSWSPDGAWIACEGSSGLFTKTSIYLASADGNQIIKLTNNGQDSNPVWAPK